LGAILVIREEADTSPLPLEQTRVQGEIIGALASVTVTQQFGNPFKQPIELEYLFPLPAKGAIVDYQITIGNRTIRADLKEIETARRTYQEAVAQGKRASLLEQRRPNLFAIQIGNVQPNEKIITTLQYEDRLKFDDGAYEFVFPMGLTPRYHSPSETTAAGTPSIDSPLALDESQVAPVELSLSVDAGVNIDEPLSRTHKIQITRENAQRLTLHLAERTLPNQDFVLRYVVAEKNIAAALWLSQDEGADTVVLNIVPPRLDITAEPAPREFIFVVDRSGSMSTQPMQQAKNALRACLRALTERDTFLMQAFDDQIEWYQPQAQALNETTLAQAEQWINTLDSRGGTEILPAIDAALAIPADAERVRYVVFLTDGEVSADNAALGKIAQQRGTARIFTFGIGPSVNRYLLDKMAELGRGAAEFLGANDDIEKALTRFQDRVSYPALLDVALTWQNAETWDTYPAVLPDLYSGQPLELVTQLKRQGASKLLISGKAGGRALQMTVDVPAATSKNPLLARLHARARIESLMDTLHHGGDEEKVRKQIISLALDQRLVTAYTAFVAVDSEVITNADPTQKIRVSTPLPEGLDLAGFVGGGAASGASQMLRMALPASPPKPSTPPMSAYMPLDEPDLADFEVDEPITDADENLPGWGSATSKPPAETEEAPKGFIAKASKFFGGGKKQADSRMTDQFVDKLLKREAGGELPEMEREVDHKPASRMTEKFVDDLTGRKDAPITVDVDEHLKALARTQKLNGSWEDDVELTAAALLAYVHHGHTTRAGDYRRQVAKALHWLTAQVPSASGFALFTAARALADLHAATGDGTPLSEMPLPPATTILERAAAGDKGVTILPEMPPLDQARLIGLIGLDLAAVTAPLTEQFLIQTWLAVKS
jgi:Ca-activated chloride channel family protein